jgi:hypothetical protein
VLSQEAARRVLILGRFAGARMKVLRAVSKALQDHPRGYVPTLFDFEKPEGRDLGETILLLALLSRFAIADLTTPRSLPAELQLIVPSVPSLPIQPIIRRGEAVFPLFENLARRESMLPLLEYDNVRELLARLEDDIVENAEARCATLRSRI